MSFLLVSLDDLVSGNHPLTFTSVTIRSTFLCPHCTNPHSHKQSFQLAIVNRKFLIKRLFLAGCSFFYNAPLCHLELNIPYHNFSIILAQSLTTVGTHEDSEIIQMERSREKASCHLSVCLSGCLWDRVTGAELSKVYI